MDFRRVEATRDPIREWCVSRSFASAVVVLEIHSLPPKIVGLPISRLCLLGVFSMTSYPLVLCRFNQQIFNGKNHWQVLSSHFTPQIQAILAVPKNHFFVCFKYRKFLLLTCLLFPIHPFSLFSASYAKSYIIKCSVKGSMFKVGPASGVSFYFNSASGRDLGYFQTCVFLSFFFFKLNQILLLLAWLLIYYKPLHHSHIQRLPGKHLTTLLPQYVCLNILIYVLLNGSVVQLTLVVIKT